MIESPADLSDDFVVTLDGEVIGKMGAWRLPEFGFILRSDLWGRGYAREALAAFLDYMFRSRGAEFLTADVDPRNAPSLRLLADHGFIETGRATATWTTHIGVCDSVYLRLDRATWLSANRKVLPLDGGGLGGGGGGAAAGSSQTPPHPNPSPSRGGA